MAMRGSKRPSNTNDPEDSGRPFDPETLIGSGIDASSDVLARESSSVRDGDRSEGELPYFLRTISLFEGLPDHVLEWAVPKVVEQTYEQDTAIISQGGAPNGLYIVRRGSARAVLRGVDETSSVILSVLTPGRCFSLVSLIDQLPHSATVEAAERTDCVRVPPDVFDQFHAYPVFNLGLLRTLTAMVRTGNEWIAQLI